MTVSEYIILDVNMFAFRVDFQLAPLVHVRFCHICYSLNLVRSFEELHLSVDIAYIEKKKPERFTSYKLVDVNKFHKTC